MSRFGPILVESAATTISRVARRLPATSVFLGLSCLLGYAAYFPLHNYFAIYDDEGYWLISLRSYHLHGSLYHDTFAQVGPLFYEFWSVLFSVTGLLITLDAGRTLTLGVWIATSLIFGIALWLFTKRLILGLLAQVLTFLLLLSLINEPMEPAGLAHFFSGCALIGVACVVRRRVRLGIVVIGVAVTAVMFTKVNIGLFLAAALLYSLIISWPGDRHVRSRQVIGAAILLLVPTVLMVQSTGENWVKWLFLVEVFSIVGLARVVGAAVTYDTTVQVGDIFWCLVAGAVTAVLISIGVLINGTTLGQLVVGAFLSQRNIANIAQIPLAISGLDVLLAGICASLAIAVASRPSWVGGAIRVAVGIWLCVSIVGSLRFPPLDLPGFNAQSYLLAGPLAWIPLLRRSCDENQPLSFARVFVCAAGVLGFLEAYPGAASQRSWAFLTLIPVALLCIDDGIEILRTRVARRGRNSVRLLVSGASVVVVVFVTLPLVHPVTQLLSHDRALYYNQQFLGLPGARTLRLNQVEVDIYRKVSSLLKSRCSTFESLPGLNSFYFFTREEPPTDLNTTQWWKLLDQATQYRVVDRLRHAHGLCILWVPALVAFWDQGRPLAQTALVRYLEHGFVLAKRIEGAWVYVRAGATNATGLPR